MKSPTLRLPLRSLNRKNQKKKEQTKLQDKVKPCPTSVTLSLSSASLPQTSSYSSCTSSLASSAQTRKSVEPPGWVHNPPPSNADILLKENNLPSTRSGQYPPSNTPRRQWVQHDVVPSPVRVLSPQLPTSSNILTYQRQGVANVMVDNEIQMSYSESSCSEGSSISSVDGVPLGPSMGLQGESAQEHLDAERFESAGEIIQQINTKFERCQETDERQSNLSPPINAAALLDMGRMQEIYASMMLQFKEKIISELREEMKRDMQDILKSEMKEMSNRLENLERNRSSLLNSQQSLQQSESCNCEAQQQMRLEELIDDKIAKAMAGLNVNKVKRESPDSKNQTCTFIQNEKPELGFESTLISESFAEAKQSIDEFVDDCDNLANEIDAVVSRMEDGGESGNDSF